jgi:sorting nexin-25
LRSAASRPTSGSHLAKPQMQQQPDLRRAVVSASDLRTGNRERKPLFEDETVVRTSFESNNSGSTGTGTASLSRPPLFEDDVDSDRLAGSTNSLFDSDHENAGTMSAPQDPKVVDAMQEALNNIMEEEPDKDEDSMRGSMELPPQRTASMLSTTSSFGQPTRSSAAPGQRLKPSIASLGLVDAAPTARGVFHDDLFADEQIRFPEDDKLSESSDEEKPSSKKHNSDDDIHEAAPGDLGLAEAIDALTLEIEKLVTQESIVDSLTNKAELTNNAAELRILRKSKASLQREINRKELQRQQYIVQESDSSLHGRATVGIKSVMTGTAEDGREFAMCKFCLLVLWHQLT